MKNCSEKIPDYASKADPDVPKFTGKERTVKGFGGKLYRERQYRDPFTGKTYWRGKLVKGKRHGQ